MDRTAWEGREEEEEKRMERQGLVDKDEGWKWIEVKTASEAAET